MSFNWKEKFNKLDDLIEIVYKKYSKILQENKELKSNPSKLEEENFHLKDRIEQLTEENISLRTQIKILEEENKVIKEDFNNLKEKVLELITKLEKFDEIIKEENDNEIKDSNNNSENISKEYEEINNNDIDSITKEEKEENNDISTAEDIKIKTLENNNNPSINYSGTLLDEDLPSIKEIDEKISKIVEEKEINLDENN